MLRTALLPTKQADENDIHGTMFIANRGTYGEGCYSCPRCNYFEAAQRPSAQQIKGKDPMSGTDCSVTELKYPLDYAHIFNTDVRLLRFTRPLPPPPDGEPNPRRFQDRFAQILSAALRFASAELLSVQIAEVRATYRMNGALCPLWRLSFMMLSLEAPVTRRGYRVRDTLSGP